MQEYRRAAGIVWFFVAAIGLLNVALSLLLGQQFQLWLWVFVTLMAIAQGVFSLRTPFATVDVTELRFRIAIARREQTVAWASVSSWSVDRKGRRVDLTLSDGNVVRVPVTAIRKELRDSFVNEFRTRVGAPSAG